MNKSAEDAAAETFKWATEKITEQAQEIGNQQDTIEQLERDKAELVKTVGFLWGKECAHSEEQLTEYMDKIMAKYFPPLKESENE